MSIQDVMGRAATLNQGLNATAAFTSVSEGVAQAARETLPVAQDRFESIRFSPQANQSTPSAVAATAEFRSPAHFLGQFNESPNASEFMKEVHSQLQDPSFKPAAGLKSFAALRISESLENVQLPAGTPAALGYGGKTAELAPGVSAALGYGGKLGALDPGTPAALGYGGKTAELAPGVSAALGYGGKLGALDPGTPAALGYGGKTAELAPGSPVALGYGGAQTPLNSLKNLETTVNSLLQMTDLLNSRNTDLR